MKIKVKRDLLWDERKVTFTDKEIKEIKKRNKLYSKLPKWAKGKVSLNDLNMILAREFEIYS